jgi:hypothetical protein
MLCDIDEWEKATEAFAGGAAAPSLGCGRLGSHPDRNRSRTFACREPLSVFRSNHQITDTVVRKDRWFAYQLTFGAGRN